MRLLAAVTSSEAPPGLREMEQVEILRQIWVHHFHLVEGEFRRRDPKGRPPGATRLVTPYAPQARGSVKRDTVWDGYKVHLTETCGTDGPNLITNMATTVATVPDSVMSETIHADLAEHGCLPGEHWVDTGYPTAAQIVTARREHGIELHGPLQSVTVAQAKNGGGYGQDAFTIDWDQQHVTCPNGATSTLWSLRSSQQQLPVIRIMFGQADCRPCPALRDCVSSPAAKRRQLTLRQHDEHQALQQTRALQQTDGWKDRYKIRAGVEGSISQGVGRCGLRRSRYQGLAKTSLQHQLTGAATNLARIDAHLTDTPRARTRTSHFAALRPVGSDGAKHLGPN